MVAGPNRSSPTRAIMETRAPPSRAVAAETQVERAPEDSLTGPRHLVGECGQIDIRAAYHRNMRFSFHGVTYCICLFSWVPPTNNSLPPHTSLSNTPPPP